MDSERDKQRLREYEAELAEAEAHIRKAQLDASALRNIVDGLRLRLGISPSAASTQGSPGLKVWLGNLVQDHGSITTDQALAALRESEDFDKVPSRNTVVSRLGDLVREGKARSPARGVYESLSYATGGAPYEGNGTIQLEPEGRIAPDGERTGAQAPGVAA